MAGPPDRPDVMPYMHHSAAYSNSGTNTTEKVVAGVAGAAVLGGFWWFNRQINAMQDTIAELTKQQKVLVVMLNKSDHKIQELERRLNSSSNSKIPENSPTTEKVQTEDDVLKDFDGIDFDSLNLNPNPIHE